VNLTVRTPGQYGALQRDFAFAVHDGYQVLTGPNNSGKSAMLQLALVAASQQQGQWSDHVALLLPDRDHVLPTTETGGRQLVHYNQELLGQIQSAPLPFDGQPRGPTRSQLTSLLLGHTHLVRQVNAVNELLNSVGLPSFVVQRGQQIQFAEAAIQAQGTGMRSLLTILSALTDDDLSLICIDEPEVSLEPGLQKALRDLLIQKAMGPRTILVATHSHLFLNRQHPPANHKVTRSPQGVVSVQPQATQEDLFNLTFDLLGSDTEDLFFPGNYWVVEGSFDQAICQRALSLLNVPSTRVKVTAAGGMTKVVAMLNAMLMSLTPLTMNDSPGRGPHRPAGSIRGSPGSRSAQVPDRPVVRTRHPIDGGIRAGGNVREGSNG
jgi:ABC-type ATPase involved in cell division